MKGRPVVYSEEEQAWLEANWRLPRAAYHRGFVAKFPRPDVTLDNLVKYRRRKGWKTGHRTRFVPGHRGFRKDRGQGVNHAGALCLECFELATACTCAPTDSELGFRLPHRRGPDA